MRIQRATTAAPATTERTMEARTPMFISKRTGRAAEFEVVVAGAPVLEPEGEVAVVALLVLLMVTPKAEDEDVRVVLAKVNINSGPRI